MHALALPGLHAWSRWQDDRQMFFSSYLLVRDDGSGNVAFDPLPTDATEEAEIEALGGVAHVLLTNRDHERGAAAMRDRFGARILASRLESQTFGLKVDDVFEPGMALPPCVRFEVAPEVLPGIVAVALDGAKTAGEVAFVLSNSRAAIVGDALLGTPAGALSFLPDTKLRDPVKLAMSLRRLWALELRALLLCDGAPILSGADDALAVLLETRGGPAVNTINLDELEWETFDDVDGRYKGEAGEIGLAIGARKLGYRAVKLPPGARFCPLHAHDKEEEVFFVIEGRPTIRTLRGDLELRPGDFMAFPVGDRGTHQVLNESDAACTLILFGNDDPDEVSYYPDSHKLGLRRRALRMRADRLDYYDGE